MAHTPVPSPGGVEAIHHCSSIQSATTWEALTARITDAIKSMDLDQYAYVSNQLADVTGAGPLVLDNYNDEFRAFRYDDFFRRSDDPVRRHVQKFLPPITWSSHGRVGGFPVPVPATAKQILGIAGEFGHCAGMSVPILASGNRVALATFSTTKTSSERDLVSLLTIGKLLADTIHAASLRIAASEILTSPLTERERETLALISVGMSAKEAARHMGISFHTVRDYLNEGKKKLGVSTTAAAIRLATDLQLI